MTAVWTYVRTHAKAFVALIVAGASWWVTTHNLTLPAGWEVTITGLLTALVVGAVPNAPPA